MKYYLLSIAVMAVAMNGCKSKTETKKYAGIDIANLDTTVDPMTDFFHYANGGWLKANPIPADQSRWGSFNILNEDNKKHLKEIAESAAAKTNVPKGSPEQLVGDLYYSAMDTVNIEKKGVTPIKADMEAIEQINDLNGVFHTAAKLQMLGPNPIFGFYVGQDPKNSEVVVPQIYQGGISLPDRDFYVKDDVRSKTIRDEYIKHVTKMFELYGLSSAEAAKNAQTVMRIETDLAKASMTRVEQRDPYKTYHKVSVADLNAITPSLKWSEMLNDLKITGKYDYLVLGQPDFLKEVEHQLKSTSINDWKIYLKWHLLNFSGNLLTNDFVTEQFHFNNQVLNGQKEIQARWKRMVSMTDMQIGEALGQLYVQKYFPPDAKKKADELVSNLMTVYKERINRLDWMSSNTKQKATEKLSTIMRKIGYPDKFKDYAGLDITRDNFYQNVVNANIWNYNYMVAKVGKPVDRTEWGMTPPTVNAYYNPQLNEIVFPAGILQPPFFNPDADDAVNYGGIGAVIGHEMTHGFDDEGRNYDAKGNLTNWWTSEDSAKFLSRAQRVVNQFNSFVVNDSLHVNGQLTLGENLADLGGLSIAYEAFKKTPEGKSDEKIDGFTPDQRFFLGFARIWAGHLTPEMAAQRIVTDPHSPMQYRVNGPLSNMQEFYKAFAIKEGSGMWRTDSVRASIW